MSRSTIEHVSRDVSADTVSDIVLEQGMADSDRLLDESFVDRNTTDG